MAKISTYPGPSSPSLSDMLIGTDVNDMNATKNFTIGDILSVSGSSTYVPYTGGNNDVFLPGYGFYANEFVVYGGSSSQFLKADGSIDSNAYALASSITGLVPYTGATGNVDLGAYRLTATSLRIVTDDVEMVGITPISAVNDYFEIGSWGWNASGLLIDFVNNVYIIGDRLGIVNGTYLKVDDANSRIEISNALYTNGSVGAVGDVLVSQGIGLPAQWTSALAPVYGSFYDVNSQTTLGNTEELMQFGTTDISSGVTIVNNGLGDPTRITVASTGVYNIQFSAQLTKTGGSTGDVYIYLKKNGIIVPDSNTQLTLANNGHYVVASWNFFVQLNAGQYAEIAWYSTNANVELHYDPIPVVGLPAIPSIILTVNKVS